MAKCYVGVVSDGESDGEYKLVVAGDASRCGAVAGLGGGVTLGGGALKSDIDAESGTNHTAHTIVKMGGAARIEAFKQDVNHTRKQPPAAGIFFLCHL